MEEAREQGDGQTYEKAFRRYRELICNENENLDDPLVRDFCETMAEYEHELSKKITEIRRPFDQ